MALTAADIAQWPATPRMKSIRPAIAERLDNPDLGLCIFESVFMGDLECYISPCYSALENKRFIDTSGIHI